MTLSRKESKPKHKSAAAWHRYWVFSDLEFLKDLHDQLFEGQEKPDDYFQSTYFISQADIHGFIVGLESDEIEPNNTLYGITNSVRDKTITIRFSQDITRQEYEQNWVFLRWYRDRVLHITPPVSKKQKAPENTKLLYAIFRARNGKKPTTFREIFRNYQDGKLPYYEGGGNTAFKSEDSLEAYYQKYKPVKPITYTKP